MATRYIWEVYDIKVTPSDGFTISDPVTATTVATTGELGDENNRIAFEEYDSETESFVIRCLPSEMAAIDDAITVRSRVYYKLEDPADTDPGATYDTCPYVIGELGDVKDTIFNITDVTTGTDVDGHKYIDVTYVYVTEEHEDIYSRGDTFKTYATSISNTAYPIDGCVDPAEEKWYHYISSDVIDIKQENIVFNPIGIPLTGGAITVTITPPDSTIEGTVSRDWFYTVDDGNGWVPYTTNSTAMQYIINADNDSTGFGIAIQAHDEYGYVGDIVQSSKIYLVENLPPSAPKFKPFSERIVVGDSYLISWDESTDVDGVIYGYILEKAINRSDDWKIIYQGQGRTVQDTIETGTDSVQYRVSAFDNKFAYSAQTYSDHIYTEENTPPKISGSNSNLGLLTTFEQTYTVSDPGNKVHVIEYFDNTIINQYDNVEGISHTINLNEGTISKLENGVHTIRVNATDEFGAVSNRTWVFKKGNGSQSDDKVNRYRIFRKMEDGTYKAVRFENDSTNVMRLDENVSVETSLDNYLPELRQTNDPPTDITKGKIVVGRSELFAKGANGELIKLEPAKPPYIAGNNPPTDTTRLWIDTRDYANPLLRYYNGTAWILLKSIYSGGTRDK